MRGNQRLDRDLPAPIVALVLGIVVLGEPVAWTLFAGTVLILVGIAVPEGRLRGLWASATRSPRSLVQKTFDGSSS